jgi:peptidoglycan-associated lipoprotein
MSKLRPLIVVVCILCCVVGLVSVLAARAVAQDRDGQDQDADSVTAAELLEDGLDALSDHAQDSGRRLLARVISEYPGTGEASRAKRALAALDRGDVDPEYRAQIKADEVERTTEYRHAFLVDVGDRVFFAENSSGIGGRARSIIEQQARWLAARPELSVMVIGRADGEGDWSAARDLSLSRAQAVRDRLVAAGLGATRIEIKAAGDQDRIAICQGALCEAQNRNAEVLLNYWHFDSGWRSSQQIPGMAKPAVGAMARPPRDSSVPFSQ